MMNLSNKTIQKHIDFFIENECDWVDVIYRSDDWALTLEVFAEDDIANFYFSNGKTCFYIDTDPVFHSPNGYEQLKSARVIGNINSKDMGDLNDSYVRPRYGE